MTNHEDKVARNLERYRDNMPDADYREALQRAMYEALASTSTPKDDVDYGDEDETLDDMVGYEPCPACGEPICYCQGHGEMG